MKKKCIIIYIDGIPVMICDVKEIDPYEYIERQHECQDNLMTYVTKRYNKEKELIKRIEELEHQIRVLKGEEED